MLKYVDAVIGLAEVPDEISLVISFSGCDIKCPGCHSAYLQEDIGECLTHDRLSELILGNDGITCVCFFGGDALEVSSYAGFVKDNFPLKVAYYTGLPGVPPNLDLDCVDYLKIGPYVASKGGLDNPRTNQRMYRIENITHEFRRGKP